MLGLGGKSLKQGTFLGVPAAEPASNLAVFLALVTTPVLMIGAYLGLVLRRRRSGI